MTRRQRHIRILDNFGGLAGLTGNRRVKWELDRLLSIHGLDLFTDEAIEMLASRTVSSHRFAQRINRENRARRQA
jgi:hypothetical protein